MCIRDSNNMGGVGNGDPYGDGGGTSQACALCKGQTGFMNQGPCATGTGQNHGACYWKQESCAAFDDHVIYDRWWQGSESNPDPFTSTGGLGGPLSPQV